MDYSRIEMALHLARQAMEEGLENQSKAIAEKIIDATILPEEKLEIKSLVLGVFMALFAMMDAAIAVKNLKDNDYQKKTKINKKDSKLVH